MAKILCVTTSLTGMVHASFELISRLHAAGHQVTYACPWDIEASVQKQGFDYRQLTPINFDPAPPPPSASGPLAGVKRLLGAWLTMRTRQNDALTNLDMTAFRQTLDDIKPDLLLIDLELHEYILRAVGDQIPTVLLSQWFSIWRRPNLPPITTAIIPGQSWQGQRWGLALVWHALQLRRKLGAWRTRLRSAFTDRSSILMQYAHQVSFPANELTELYYFPPPLTYRNWPVISLTAWDLEFPHSPRPNLFYVGPMVYETRQDAQTDPAVDQTLAQIFANRAKQKFQLIYCSVSTMGQGDQGFLQRVVEAFVDQSDWQLIIGLGGAENFLRDVPDNVHVFDWVPQLQVLQHADCSINHGGIHTINECLHFGIPMLIYSGKRFDQNACAARVAFHGLGIMADKDQDGVQAIQQRVETILNDPSYKSRVDALRRKLKDQREDVVRVIEKFLPEYES